MRVTLRPYQQGGIDNVREAYRNGRTAPLFVLPTGGGKSVVAAFISENAAAKGNRVLICAHRVELITQLSKKLSEIGLEHGVISPSVKPRYHLPVQVASVATAVRRFAHLHAPDFILIDEAHHVVEGNQWGQILRAYPKARVLGLTATPCRLDGKGLGRQAGGYFDAIVQGPTVRNLTELGFLVPATYYAPRVAVNLDGLVVRHGDYAPGALGERMSEPTVIGDAVEHYRKACDGKPAIAFCASVAHSEAVAKQFTAAGYRAVHVDGTTPTAVREKAIADLGAGALHVLANCGIVSEGTDVPVVTAAIMLRPTKSTSLWLQMCGRVLRPSPGKDRAIILDHAGNVMNHGFVDDEREWSLEGAPKKSREGEAKAPAAAACPVCFAIHVPAPKCPQCGHFYKPAAAREIVQGKGELEELKEADKRAISEALKKEVRDARTLDDLKSLARARGYSPRWADHIWRSRQERGLAPRGRAQG